MALVELTADADAQFHALPRGLRPRVMRLFERLESWPAVGECGREIIACSFTPDAMMPPMAVGE